MIASADVGVLVDNPILEIDHIAKEYGSVPAVSDVSLSVRKGEFLCIIGPSGCGKSTLLRMIAGFIQPSSGDIRLNGQSMIAKPPYERPVNMVFQNYALFPHLNVGQNVGFGLEMRKVGSVERLRRVREVLKAVELSGFEDRAVTELSGGQQQRVALARALVLRPNVLLLDEPLGALDQKVRRKMQVELLRIHREVGITFIHVTHDQEEALALSDRIAVMSKGRIEQVATRVEVYSRPASAFVADFVGESNQFIGVVERDPQGGLGVYIGESQWVAVPQKFEPFIGSRVDIFVRPEDVEIAPKDETGLVTFDGVVREVVFLGGSARLHVDVVGHLEIVANVSASSVGVGALVIGSRVRLGWAIEASHIFRERC